MQHFPVPTLVGIDVFIPHGEQATAFKNQLGQILYDPRQIVTVSHEQKFWSILLRVTKEQRRAISKKVKEIEGAIAFNYPYSERDRQKMLALVGADEGDE